MSRLVKNKALGWTICAILCLFVIWLLIFGIGWIATRPEAGPTIEGKSLYRWDADLDDGSLQDSANSPQRTHATAVLRRHYVDILPTVFRWAERRESLWAKAYFTTLDFLLPGKISPYGYGEAAHSYRGRAARILGALGPVEPRVISTLEQIRGNADNADYEREIASASLERISYAAKQKE